MNTPDPITPESSSIHLAEAYLHDLDRALTAAEPREREETLAEVSEQLREAAAADPSGERVRNVIADLGPVDAIAAAAAPAPTLSAAVAEQPQPKDWFVIGTTALSGVALVTAFLFFPLAAIIALVTFVLAIVQMFTSKMGRMLPVLSIVMSAVVLVIAALAIIGMVAWQQSFTEESHEVIEDEAGQMEESP